LGVQSSFRLVFDEHLGGSELVASQFLPRLAPAVFGLGSFLIFLCREGGVPMNNAFWEVPSGRREKHAIFLHLRFLMGLFFIFWGDE